MAFSLNSFDERMSAAIDFLKTELKKLRTGRATVSLLDDVVIDAYGGKMRIPEVASLSAPDATLLVIQPWDKSLLEAIEKGIQAANVNLHPIVDGDIVRIAVPSLTEDNRKDMVKRLHQMAEAGRVNVRTLRNDTKKQIEQQKGGEGISEDDIQAETADLEKKVQKALETIETLVKQKEQELLTL
ncbi:MAG: ribosome recycling factor [Candidatus Pacebacteria bacterium CG10_big_fil_rev_8_21_14_0_10_42_12]|nr:ribosome recycling factor [Candidatus Paceibacterota bacterium]PIR62328.1 MAG: ribosome recycling factor [Candidatus Pacebacteria bacterium CG10_big_fil_rev_8_21_14_0_10_42_12]